MKKEIRHVDKAVEEAQKSSYRIKVGCILYRKNRIYSRGHNDPLKSARKLHPHFQKWPGSIHAEVDAILHARRNLEGCNALIVRINRFGQFRLSKPCAHCLSYLERVGIKKITYTTDKYPFFIVAFLHHLK